MKVGDYVRTKSGYIDKIININDCREPSMKYALEQPSWNDDVIFIGEEKIKKSSPNIIDLIEIGDYVNGERVDYIDDCKGAMREFYYTFEDVTHDVGHYEEEIETIVTKEQFESMEFKL